MAIYRFRVLWEEDESVERTILIKSNQTFLDFFNITTEGFELDNKNVSASFFVSDEYWDKHAEITLREEDVQGNEKLMHKTKIASVIEQPKQRFVFVYDEKLQLTFLVELIKIEKDSIISPDEKLPKIISSKNKIPKRRKVIQIQQKENNINNIPNFATNITSLSDDEFDNMIYNSIMNNKDIAEDDILNKPIEEILKDINKNADIDMHEEEENETEILFDEGNNMFDDDDFSESGYYNTNDEYED